MKAKKRTITLDPTKFRPKLTTEQRKAFTKAAKVEIKNIREHFRRPGHGWDLDFRLIEEAVVYGLVGYSPSWELIYRITELGHEVVMDGNRIIVKKGKKP